MFRLASGLLPDIMSMGDPNMKKTDLRNAVATESAVLSGNGVAIMNSGSCFMLVNAKL